LLVCLLVMGASLLHADVVERAGQAAGGRPQASGNGRLAVTSAFRSMIRACLAATWCCSAAASCCIRLSVTSEKAGLEIAGRNMMGY